MPRVSALRKGLSCDLSTGTLFPSRLTAALGRKKPRAGRCCCAGVRGGGSEENVLPGVHRPEGVSESPEAGQACPVLWAQGHRHHCALAMATSLAGLSRAYSPGTSDASHYLLLWAAGEQSSAFLFPPSTGTHTILPFSFLFIREGLLMKPS